MMSSFWKEEEGQGQVEWILMLGAILVAAVMIASSYYKLSYRAFNDFDITVNDTYNTVCGYLEKNLGIFVGSDVTICK